MRGEESCYCKDRTERNGFFFIWEFRPVLKFCQILIVLLLFLNRVLWKMVLFLNCNKNSKRFTSWSKVNERQLKKLEPLLLCFSYVYIKLILGCDCERQFRVRPRCSGSGYQLGRHHSRVEGAHRGQDDLGHANLEGWMNESSSFRFWFRSKILLKVAADFLSNWAIIMNP